MSFWCAHRKPRKFFTVNSQALSSLVSCQNTPLVNHNEELLVVKYLCLVSSGRITHSEGNELIVIGHHAVRIPQNTHLLGHLVYFFFS